MIRQNFLFCKLNRIKISSKQLFARFMRSFRPELMVCPCCGAKGLCRIHAYYGRSLVDFIGGEKVRHDLCILRLACSCGHTHAVLPDFIIPYCGYSLFFLLRLLGEYFARLHSMEKLCERFSVTRNQLLHWLGLFESQKEEWLGLLDSLETSSLSFLESLATAPHYSDFSCAFVCRFAKSFLQGHKNPALPCRQESVPPPVFP